MSLINRMLQDLDSRGTESVGKGAMYAQIRSVPEAPKTFSLRWIWLVVPAVLVIAIIAWQWMPHSAKINKTIASNKMIEAPIQTSSQASNQVSNAVESSVQTSLIDLKLSSDLSLTPLQGQQPTLQSPIDKNDSSNSAEVDIARPPLANNKQVGLADDKKSALDKSVEIIQKLNTNSTAAKSIAVPASIPVTPKENVSAAPAKVSEADPIIIHKQVNELTVQQRAENEYRKALLLIQQSKPAEAIAGMEQALQLDRQKVSARQALAGLLIDANRQDEAVRRLQEGLAIDPAQAGLAMILARLQVEKGELKHALETLEHTLPYAAERADYQAFLAALLQRDGRNKEAVEHYAVALHQNPQNGIWWMGLGISLHAENRLPEAREAFGRAKSSNVLTPELQVFVDQKLNQLKQ
ncbi:MAG TPA: tetratricopeptide repeat protein [Burkholderiaceae bacterium]|jgi:MSHA biogenesis protein MshN